LENDDQVRAFGGYCFFGNHAYQKALPDFLIFCVFSDGTEKIANLKPYLSKAIAFVRLYLLLCTDILQIKVRANEAIRKKA
jgi:hypothetical protein